MDFDFFLTFLEHPPEYIQSTYKVYISPVPKAYPVQRAHFSVPRACFGVQNYMLFPYFGIFPHGVFANSFWRGQGVLVCFNPIVSTN